MSRHPQAPGAAVPVVRQPDGPTPTPGAPASTERPSLVRRVVADAIDVVAVAIPLLVGAGFLALLGDGAGQADIVVFGGAALAVAVAVAVVNSGRAAGLRGQSVGKSWTSLVLRDPETHGPVGTRAALRARGEVVGRKLAVADGFAPAPVDRSRPAVRRRRLLGIVALVVLLVLVMLASIAVGARALDLTQVLHAVFTPNHTDTDQVVRSLRLPRTLLGAVVGIALGVAGALIQGHTRNPLADSGLLGLNAGAALLVVLGIHFLGMHSPDQYLWLAFLGAFIASIVVFGFASLGAAGAGPLTLVLAGAAVSFFMQAMTNAVVLLDQNSLEGYRFWVVGSLAGRGMDVFWQVLPFIVVGLILALVGTPALNTLSLGEDMARSLGTNIVGARIVGIAAITLLVGGATAACGPIAFVGLVAPHIVRTVTGPDYRWLVPYAGLCGAVMVLAADVLGRVVVRPGELQAGIILAIVGAPFFIALVRRRKLVSL